MRRKNAAVSFSSLFVRLSLISGHKIFPSSPFHQFLHVHLQPPYLLTFTHQPLILLINFHTSHKFHLQNFKHLFHIPPISFHTTFSQSLISFRVSVPHPLANFTSVTNPTRQFSPICPLSHQSTENTSIPHPTYQLSHRHPSYLINFHMSLISLNFHTSFTHFTHELSYISLVSNS